MHDCICNSVIPLHPSGGLWMPYEVAAKSKRLCDPLLGGAPPVEKTAFAKNAVNFCPPGCGSPDRSAFAHSAPDVLCLCAADLRPFPPPSDWAWTARVTAATARTAPVETPPLPHRNTTPPITKYVCSHFTARFEMRRRPRDARSVKDAPHFMMKLPSNILRLSPWVRWVNIYFCGAEIFQCVRKHSFLRNSCEEFERTSIEKPKNIELSVNLNIFRFLNVIVLCHKVNLSHIGAHSSFPSFPFSSPLSTVSCRFQAERAQIPPSARRRCWRRDTTR